MSMWLDGTGREAERLWRRGRIAVLRPDDVRDEEEGWRR